VFDLFSDEVQQLGSSWKCYSCDPQAYINLVCPKGINCAPFPARNVTIEPEMSQVQPDDQEGVNVDPIPSENVTRESENPEVQGHDQVPSHILNSFKEMEVDEFSTGIDAAECTDKNCFSCHLGMHTISNSTFLPLCTKCGNQYHSWCYRPSKSKFTFMQIVGTIFDTNKLNTYII
jgi:hypothetical protein